MIRFVRFYSAEAKTRIANLAQLDKASTRLIFKSLPYGSPNSSLFPPSSAISSSCANNLFSLRAFKPTKSSTISRQRSPASLQSTPPPWLEYTVSDSPSPLLTPEDVRANRIKLKYDRKPYSMDLTILAGKKKVHKSAVIRERCKRRFREAVRLVVLRGANPVKGEIELDHQREGPRKWLIPGFTYVASIPSLEIYRHPFPELVKAVRDALIKIKTSTENKLMDAELAKVPSAQPPLPSLEPVKPAPSDETDRRGEEDSAGSSSCD